MKIFSKAFIDFDLYQLAEITEEIYVGTKVNIFNIVDFFCE